MQKETHMAVTGMVATDSNQEKNLSGLLLQEDRAGRRHRYRTALVRREGVQADAQRPRLRVDTAESGDRNRPFG